MRKIYFAAFILIVTWFVTIGFTGKVGGNSYYDNYAGRLSDFNKKQQQLFGLIQTSNLSSNKDVEKIKEQINDARIDLKSVDFWLRYLEPVVYKKLNGPLPVEWETEVFEKFEKPYKRVGAGLSLAALYLHEDDITKDTLLNLIQSSITACETYSADSITSQLQSYQHFYLCNRLYLLNLAAIYTTGFECPDTTRIVPELLDMVEKTAGTYKSFNESFPDNSLTADYLLLYERMVEFVRSQPVNYSNFDHFDFIKNYINPLFGINQQLIRQYRVYTKSFVDYTLNKNNNSIFNKALYNGQNPKGIFLRVDDTKGLAEIERVGKLLYYDPILSGNNLRSCNSCHNSTEYFTDTLHATSLQFNGKDHLTRNAPSLINAKFNHLLMLDGKHISLQNQLKDVMMNPNEMGSSNKNLLKKILSCKEYKKTFTTLLKYTPQEKQVTIDHIVSAITFYYSKFSNYYSPFDDAISNNKTLDNASKQGFNLFMGKAHCGTCHFVPHFNGIKPPYVSTEFEVLGVPADKKFTRLSDDKGRYELNNAFETMNAMRTGSIRNAEYTKPYMHNGVFSTLDEVIDFYDAGGGAGHGLKVVNQTLSADSLHLLKQEKVLLLSFIKSLNEKIEFEAPPAKLPLSVNKALNKRKVGGIN